jgi:hypothetical protein
MATTRRGIWSARQERRQRDAHLRRKGLRSHADRPDRGLRPRLDVLEDRVTPSTFTPTSFADLTTSSQSTLLSTDVNSFGQIISRGDVITLRSAVIAADKAGGSNTINLASGTYQLSIAPSAGSNGASASPGAFPTSGDLAVSSALTITGQGSASTIVEAGTTSSNGISKVFSFNPLGSENGFAVSLTGLTIQNGRNNSNNDDGDGEGGAFDFDAGPDGLGSLTMNDVVVNDNSTINGDGGGIALFDAGVVSITNSKFTNNTANGVTGGGTGGAIFIAGSAGTVTGNALLTISASTISGNQTAGADGGDGGGILSDADFPVVIHNTTISGNSTGAAQGFNGGGIADEGSASFTVDQGSVISINSASRWGGGIYSTSPTTITDVSITNNSAGGGMGSTHINEGGGGIFADEASSTITVTDSRIVGNTATVGGSQLDGDGGSSDGGVLDAANNWFGSNTPSASFFGAGVKTLTTSPFLVMTFGASPTTLSTGGTSVLTAAITKNSANATGFFVPNTTPVTFSGGTIGSVSPSSGFTSGGTGTSTFTAGATLGKGNVSATIDNQTLTVQLTIIGVPTANPQSASVNENSSVNLTLTGSDPDEPALPLTFAIVAGHGPANGTITNFNPATGTLTYTPNANFFGSDSFQFTVSNGTNTSAPATVSLTVQNVAATVSGTVGVSWGTSGTATLQTAADGLRLLPAGRNTDLPWLGINQISITLSQPETLSASDVSVTGINIANYGPVTISGSGTSYTITFAQPINAADRVTVTIGSANIATFTRRLDVLPGDFNDDGIVTLQDALLIRNEYLAIGGASPTIFGDIDGNGVVDINDYNAVRRLIGTQLP